jgi:hypothetical protein
MYVVTGAARKRLSHAATEAAWAEDFSLEYEYVPGKLKEPFLSRRRKVGYDLYAHYNIARDDYPARKEAMLRNFDFFGALVNLFFTMKRDHAQERGSIAGCSCKTSCGTTRATSPALSASAASIIRSVRHISIALALPTARVRRCEPPMPGATPRLISGWPKRALSLARMKSAIIASSQPPPRAKPLTAAIHGLRVDFTSWFCQPEKKSSR